MGKREALYEYSLYSSCDYAELLVLNSQLAFIAVACGLISVNSITKKTYCMEEAPVIALLSVVMKVKYADE